MSENEKEIKKPYEIVDIVVHILHFNEKVKKGQGLKILTLQ